MQEWQEFQEWKQLKRIKNGEKCIIQRSNYLYGCQDIIQSNDHEERTRNGGNENIIRSTIIQAFMITLLGIKMSIEHQKDPQLIANQYQLDVQKIAEDLFKIVTKFIMYQLQKVTILEQSPWKEKWRIQQHMLHQYLPGAIERGEIIHWYHNKQ